MTNNRKQLRHARTTPLASIFGSGFLVIVPILSAAVGPYAVVAMAGVCALAYAMGSVIRFNIRHAEPLFEARTISDRTARHERTANLALVLAYAISVCLYIHILAAFLLGGLGINTPFRENIVIVIIVAVSTTLGPFPRNSAAALMPVNPPPTMSTSHLMSLLSGGQSCAA